MPLKRLHCGRSIDKYVCDNFCVDEPAADGEEKQKQHALAPAPAKTLEPEPSAV